MTYTKAECLEIAASHRRTYDRLIAAYGHGVRPSWVSADLADAVMKEEKWQKKAMEAEQ